MIAQIIEVLNIAAETLPVDTRYGWAQIIDGRPRVHVGAGQWVEVAQDTNGTWSYVRANGQARVEPIDIGEPCSGVKVRLPLRLVALMDRSACDELPGLLVQTAASIRKARKQFITVSQAVNVTFNSILWQVDGFESQEFQPVPNIPTDKALVAIDILMEIDGREDCFDGCGTLTDVVCAIIQRANNAKIAECLGPDRLAELCDVPPCDPTTVNGVESDTPTITVLQGGNPVGTLNPATGVVTIPECPEGCTEPYTIKWDVDGTEITILVDADPCGGEAVLSCDTLIDAVVVEGAGTEEANGVYFVEERGVSMLWRKPDAGSIFYDVDDPPGFGTSPIIYDVDNVPLYSGLDVVSTQDPDGMDGMAWDAIDGQSPAPTVRQATLGDLCPCPAPEPCDPLTWELRDTNGDLLDDGSVEEPCGDELSIVAPDARVNWDGRGLISIPSGGLANLDCDTLVNAAYAVDGGSVTGTYKITGTANGRSIYTLDGSHRFEYSGTRWELIKPGGNYQAAVGSETFPWDADWSLTPVTVTQATIGAYCDDCEPANPVEVEVNGTLYASVPAAGSVDIPVINTATTPIGTVTPGVDVEIPDSAISVDSTPELNLPATMALNITLNDGTNPVTPVDVDTSTPGVMAIEIAPCPTPPANVLREYTADDTWSKPSSTFFQGVWVLVAGGAGSGASGSVGVTNRTGGTGGSGGALVRRWVPAASLAGTESVTIGAGGATATLSAGNNGADTSFGTHAIAKGGIGGIYNGSATQPGPAGGDVLACTPVASGMADSGAPGGQAGRTTANTLAGGDGMTAFAGAGGGGGGGYSTGGGATGGRGGGTYQSGTLTQGGAGGTAGNNGTSGVDDINLNPFGELVASTIGFGTAGGGGGGSGAAGVTGGNGGNGGRAAAGGGGGAGTVTAGTGGSGGNGFCIIYEVYG